MTPHWYTRDGKPTESPDREISAWHRLSTWEKEKRIAITTIGRFSVSTVYLGLDHQYDGGPPLIFETMIFPGDRVAGRYATEEEALRAHLWVVDRIRDGDDPATLQVEPTGLVQRCSHKGQQR